MGPATYEQAVAALERALIFGIHPSLDGIEELCEALGRPQEAFRSVQVTGTNGKTSTARLVEAMARGHGVRTGLYTSPHLERYPERIEIGGQVLPDERFAAVVDAVLDAARSCRGEDAIGTEAGYTEFEILTATALHAFREAGVEVAVLEVGMGGRWDATSVVAPAVAVVTGVGLDHSEILGDTVEKIAAEKAAIIRPQSVAVLGPGTRATRRVFLDHVDANGAVAPVTVGGEPDATVRFGIIERPSAVDGSTIFHVWGVGEYPDLSLAAPAYQVPNAATAIAAVEAMIGGVLDPGALRRALSSVRFPGRFEVARVDPPLVIDGSHNPQAASVLAAAIADAWPDEAKRPHVLLGVLRDKDVRGIVKALNTVADGFSVTGLGHPRALEVRTLAEAVQSATGVAPRCFDDMAEALRILSAEPGDGVVVTGSLVAAGRARDAWRRLGSDEERPVTGF